MEVDQTLECTRQLSHISVSDSSEQASQSSNCSSVYKPKKKIEQFIEMPFNRVKISHTSCCVSSTKYEPKEFTLVPKEARIQVFSKLKIYIPSGNRCCIKHLINKRFINNQIVSTYNNLSIISNTSNMTAEEIRIFMDDLQVLSNEEIHDKIGQNTFPEERIIELTGFNYENLKKIKDMLPSLRKSSVRDPLQAIAIFLIKLRSACSDRFIDSILSVKDHQAISSCWKSVIKAFERDILNQKKFGIKSCSRHELILNHTTNIAKELHGIDEQLVIICDGTYIYHGKSKNNSYQRKSYSGQKKTHLCKPFTICTTDGYTIDIMGPYNGNENDATILRKVLEEKDGLIRLLKPGDIFVLDRGFRDIKEELEGKGFIVLMPAFKGKRSCLTTEESNYSRFITKLRWVVEAIHGAVKMRFKFLRIEVPNRTLQDMEVICKIAFFLNNEFGKRLHSDVDMAEEIIDFMKSRLNVKNDLAREIQENNWNRKHKIFRPTDSLKIDDFPMLTIKDLKILFTGSYQLIQAIYYLAEIINDDDILEGGYYNYEGRHILRFEVQSRHKNSKQYKCYIEYISNKNEVSRIKQYACDCPNGLRTV